MASKVVAMTLIPGVIPREPKARSDLSYAKYGRASWEWWCRRHGIEFIVIDAPPLAEDYARMPPTMQRWVVADQLLEERGEDAQVALIDADTMIRWNAPDIFRLARGLSAVADPSPPDWIVRSTRAFQPLFPGISLPWWKYFNTGVVVLGAAQRRLVRAFLEYSVRNWPRLETVIASGPFGTDQTPLNFIVRRETEPVCFLPRPFNLLHCFPMSAELIQIECSQFPDKALFAAKAFARPESFNFVEFAFVFHFTNVVNMRLAVMRETWRRIRHNYPGAPLLDES